jgi:hypothetical protein
MSNDRKLSSSFWVGAIILTLGSLLLLHKMDLLEFPRWIFSWKVMLIGIGLIVGINSNFKGIGWLVMILIGSFFFLDDIPGFPIDLDRYALPVGIIILGMFIVFRAVIGKSEKERKDIWGDGVVATDSGGEDTFDLTTVFGGAKRKIFSKNFRGGRTTCIFGGSDIDMTQADINGTIIIDVVQIFGGVKMIIPANWEVKSDVSVILGGIDDKRNVPTAGLAPNKKLVLTGTVIFGGVDIKSY